MSAVAHIQEYKTGLFYTDEFRGDMSWNGYEHNVLLRNDGPDARGRLEFTDVAMALGADRVKDARGTAMADFDNDGDLDIVINNNPGDSRNQKRARATLLRNEIAKRSRSGSKLARGGVDRNRFQSRGYRRYRDRRGCWKPQMRQVEGGSGYASQHGTRLYFGLGDAAQIDALTVRWPSGAVEAYEDLKTRALVRITEGAGAEQLGHPRP